MSEEQLQAMCFQWHWNNRPEERRRLFHINQKAKNAIEGARMKAIGVVPGVPDMCYLKPYGAVLWLEFKIPTGRQSAGQEVFQELLMALGHDYRIIRSFDEFLSAIQ